MQPVKGLTLPENVYEIAVVAQAANHPPLFRGVVPASYIRLGFGSIEGPIRSSLSILDDGPNSVRAGAPVLIALRRVKRGPGVLDLPLPHRLHVRGDATLADRAEPTLTIRTEPESNG
jgi:hypothetical protein